MLDLLKFPWPKFSKVLRRFRVRLSLEESIKRFQCFPQSVEDAVLEESISVVRKAGKSVFSVNVRVISSFKFQFNVCVDNTINEFSSL